MEIEWHSIEDKQPELKVDVLTFNNKTNKIQIQFADVAFEGGSWSWSKTNKYQISHWAELPIISL